MRTLQFLLISLLLPACCLAQQLVTHGTAEGIADQQGEHNRVFSLVANNKPINTAELKQLKKHLKRFYSTLQQKTTASEHDTKTLFNPTLLLITDILAYPDTSISPDDKRYKEIEMILHDIGMNPITAMAYEESQQFPVTPLATIQPEKGPGSTYSDGELLRLAITASKDCYVQVFFVSRPEGKNNGASLKPLMFFPEPGKASVKLASGSSLILGEDGSFTVEPPYGADLILVVSSEQPFNKRSLSDNYPFSYPMNPGKLFTDIYGNQTAEKLSIHSCFIVSKPKEKVQTRSNLVLLTEEEASTLRLDEKEWARPPLMLRATQAGPVIKVHVPGLTDEKNPTIEAITPMKLKISFEEKEAPVDMDTLEVVAKKGFFTKSITDRVKEHIHGTVLEAEKLDFPKGKFRIQVEIADVHGTLTSQEYRLEVR